MFKVVNIDLIVVYYCAFGRNFGVFSGVYMYHTPGTFPLKAWVTRRRKLARHGAADSGEDGATRGTALSGPASTAPGPSPCRGALCAALDPVARGRREPRRVEL
jgi:hypothetical protein